MTEPGRPLPAVIADLLSDHSLAPLRRSLRFYYGDADRAAALDELYSRFVGPGDLVFDIGAHVGDRVASFQRLGARVVAVEPQPMCASALGRIYGSDLRVKIIQAACGGRSGILPLRVNTRNPTVSTLSEGFVDAANGARGWRQEVWDEVIAVRIVTLDSLVRRFGRPAFIKIDVEGYEDQVLAGLSAPVPALSFEYTTISREVGRRCLDRLDDLGYTGFDVSPGETLELTGRWAPKPEVLRHLLALPHEANAGDVYAVRPARGSHRAGP
ncbi:FkbM family methyltransferase [Actinoplanes sp. M2I2]|uniref:FkbM family methyltransferase n=1 Tax=Actinoplanes sp. M2I2 TaxID=1734444 RepID=UPI00201FF00B|nr:FkbM family methyltransferase [Actinoplanes sp. M2I2]